jgi:peptidase E
MTASEPTILATSGGMKRGERTVLEFAPLLHFAIELARAEARPRVCYLATAQGDNPQNIRNFYEAAIAASVEASHLALFPMPNVEDIRALLLEQDLIWVGGGSVAGLLAMWRLHGLDEAMREAWQGGVVLAGVSAGSICWHAGGPTDSFGPDLRGIDNGLGFVPFSNGVHYDSEPQRRPKFHELVASGRLPDGYATDDGVGVLYRGREFAEAVTEIPGKSAYFVRRDVTTGLAVEEAVPTRLLD